MSPEADEGFPKRLRLRRRREFLAVQRGGRRTVTTHFIVYGRPNGGRPVRLGVTVSRKYGKANRRNRLKRLVREAFRRNRSELPGGLDLVLVAKNDQAPAALAEVVAELLQAGARLRPSGPAAQRPRGRRPAR